MRITSCLASVLLATVAGAGCVTGGGPPPADDTGGDDTGGDDMPPDELTPQEFIEQLIAADCAKAFSCSAEFPATEGTFEDEWGASESECLTDDDDYLDRNAIAASVANGEITYDALAAADCLANLGHPSSCAAFFTTYDWPDTCYDAMVGNIADGASCTTWWQCGPDSDCVAGTCGPVADE